MRNAEGELLQGATVMIKGTRRAVITNAEGLFRMADTCSRIILRISFTGYQSFDIPIIDRHFLDITLDHAANYLDEAIVKAYGETTRRLNTGSIDRLNGKEIRKQPVDNLLAALEGRMPGLVVTQFNGVPGSSLSVQVRGRNSISHGSGPLIVLDGVPISGNNNSNIPSGSAHCLEGTSPQSNINTADVDNVEVLKDADATAIYGSRGANGVILITTTVRKTGPASSGLPICPPAGALQ